MGKNEASMYGVPMKYVSLLLLVWQTVGVVAAMRYSRTIVNSGPKYLNTVAVCFSEMMKLGCSVVFLWNDEERSFVAVLQQMRLHLLQKPGELLKVSIPGLLYTLQNNLLFIALSNLSGAVYQVTYQMKILTTALLSVLILNKSLGHDKWAALAILTCGVVLIQWPRDHGEKLAVKNKGHDQHSDNAVIGLVAVMFACITSGFAGVYLEKILKQSSTSIWLRNIQLALFGSIIGFIGALWTDGAKIREQGLLGGFNSMVWVVITLQAVGGLVVAAVLKYADNIMKCFGNAVSIILSCLVSAVVFQDFTPDMLFAVGTVLVLVATSIYSLGLPSWALEWWAGMPSPPKRTSGSEKNSPANRV